VPVCVAVHCGPDLYHFCSLRCPVRPLDYRRVKKPGPLVP
jgi:hypothetical protein